MSLSTWTPDALRSEFRSFKGECWRLVESQYVVSTTALVDTLDEQALLEDLLDATKPPVPVECRHLHQLLYTPFRYPARTNGRFRRIGQAEGVFYAAEAVETCVAELAFYRALFFAESPGTPFPAGFSEYTAFSVSAATDALLDISGTTDARLTHPNDYSMSQAFAHAARAASAEGIKARSVRCPKGGAILAWLTCRVFTQTAPNPLQQTWRLRLVSHGVQAICENPRRRIEFDGHAFAADARLAPLGW